MGSGPSDLDELRGTEYKTCHRFFKQLIVAPSFFKIVFSLGSKNEMFYDSKLSIFTFYMPLCCIDCIKQ